MKCRLVRDMDSPNPNFDFAELDRLGSLYDVPQSVPVAAGTVIDHPAAFRLVQMGVAEPADDDCRKAARRTPEEMATAQERYGVLLKGMGTGDQSLDADPDEPEEDDDDLFEEVE